MEEEEKNIEETIESVFQEIEEVKRSLVGKEELEEAKASTLSTLLFSLETAGAQAYDLAQNEAIAGDCQFTGRYIRGINSVERQSIQRTARTYLVPDNLTVAILLPEREELAPERPQPTPPR